MDQTKQKRKRVQLQATNVNSSRMAFNMDERTSEELEYCKDVIEKLLNMEVSAAVLLRRAIR